MMSQKLKSIGDLLLVMSPNFKFIKFIEFNNNYEKPRKSEIDTF